jgi:DNA adenine methylase
MYRNIRFDVDRVLECLRRLPTGKRSYYRIRAVSPRSLTEPERAARFIYLNKYCFNGLYRTNLDGVFNVPFGDTKGRDSIDELAIRNAARVLHNIHLIAGDFQRTLSLARPGDFVYLDPPYSVSHRRSFAEYQPAVFDDSELRRLNDSLEDLDSRNISFLVSYAESAEARILTSRWRWRTVSIRRSIAGFASHRSSINEILASNIGRELG